MHNLYVVTSIPSQGVILPIGSLSTYQNTYRDVIHFDNGNLKMIGASEALFDAIHTPCKEYLEECLKYDLLQEALNVIEQIGDEDFLIQSGNYKNAVRFQNAGGDASNQLARTRLYIRDVIAKIV